MRASPKPDKGPICTFAGSFVRPDGTESEAEAWSWAVAAQPGADSGHIEAPNSPLPLFMGKRAGSYVVSLTTTGEGGSKTSSLEILVQDLKPVIQLSPGSPGRQTLREHELYQFETFEVDASASTAPEGAKYIWGITGNQAKLTADGPTARVNARKQRGLHGDTCVRGAWS